MWNWPGAWRNPHIATKSLIYVFFGYVTVPEQQKEGDDDEEKPPKPLYVDTESGKIFLRNYYILDLHGMKSGIVHS